MSLSCSSLPISNNCWIVSLENGYHTIFCSVIVHKFLGWLLVIYVIKCEILPDTKVWIHCNVFLFFFLSHFGAQILHDTNWFAILTYLDNWSEVTSSNFLTRKWWSYSYNNFKVLWWRIAVRTNWTLGCIEHIWLIQHILLLILDHLSHIRGWGIHLELLSHVTIILYHLWLKLLQILAHLSHVDAHVHIVHFLFVLYLKYFLNFWQMFE